MLGTSLACRRSPRRGPSRRHHLSNDLLCRGSSAPGAGGALAREPSDPHRIGGVATFSSRSGLPWCQNRWRCSADTDNPRHVLGRACHGCHSRHRRYRGHRGLRTGCGITARFALSFVGQSEKSRRRLTTPAFDSSSDMTATTICHWASVTPDIGQ